MQNTESDPNLIVQRVLGLLKRRRRLIVGAASGVALLVIAALFQIPNRYTSEATLLVVQQQVPERYVVPTSTTDISKALEAMKQDVLSRGRLLAIIDELGLYPKKKQRLAPEELVEVMRADVQIAPLQSNPERREVNAFKISFIGDSPQVAQEVTSRLTTLFIEQNLKSRADQASTTTRFLREQLDAARTKLTDQEQKLKDFKMQYLGQLPEQQQGNIGILSGLQSQLQNVMASLNRAQQQKSYNESLLGEYRRMGPRKIPNAPGLPAEAQALTPLERAEQELARLEDEKQKLMIVYTAEHPDVRKKSADIVAQEAAIARIKAKSATADKSRPPQSEDKPASQAAEQAESENSPLIAQVKSQLEANRLEIDNLVKSEQKLKAEIAEYQSRLNLTPVREQQLTSMLRDYELTKQNYADLLNKEMQSQLSSSLEKRQEGQQFRLADPPNLPAVPSSPKRLKLSLAGIAGGLFIGLALAVVAEFRTRSYYSEAEIVARLGVPLVVGVPVITTAQERRAETWRTRLDVCLGTLLILCVAAAELYVLRHG